MQPPIRYAKTSDGVHIAYAVLGSGPPIVFPSSIWGNLHGYLSGMIAMSSVDAIVGLGWSVVTYDGRGAGASDRGITDFSLQARVRDLEAVLEQTRLEQFVLCGTLQGSPTSIAYTVQQPNCVSGLILSNAFSKGEEYYTQIPAMRLSQVSLDMAEEEWEFHMQTLAHAVIGYSNPERSQRLVETFRSGMSRSDYVAYRRAAQELDVTELLSQVRVPTLVVTDNSNPGVAFPPMTRRVAAAIPGARYVETTDFPSVVDEFLRGSGLVPTPRATKPANQPSVPSPPAAFRTVLFTDLVGHTEMMQRLGDSAGRELLREHERITRDAIKRHSGTEIKTDGDSFMVSFRSVAAATHCAVSLQRAFAVHNEAAAEPLRVRMGLNAGEPLEENGDLFGSTVILASRVAARAGPGEILVADTVRGLLAGKGFMFADRGDFIPKGFEDAVRLWEVRWRD